VKKRCRVSGVEDYAMSHRPPGADNGAPLHDLNANAVYPKDVYDHPEWYSGGEENFWDAWSAVSRARGKPDKNVSIFRALPCGRATKTLNNGDWVTTVRKYAREHSKHASDPSKDMCVKWARVKASCLHTAGDSLFEWGYNCEDKPFSGTVSRPRKKRERPSRRRSSYDIARHRER